MIAFDNSYARLPARFHARVKPEGVSNPSWIAFNDPLAARLDVDLRRDDASLAVLSGNVLPEGAEPLSAAYAGQQFGHWSPQLGDGRAVLLGEIVAPDGVRFDLQLKGSGRTPWSRGGDGRAWIGPVMREYLVSEAMAALNIPTSRALAAVASGDMVMRETPLPGGVLTRVARSHIRVGTFQYFAIRDDREALEALCEHARRALYPEMDGAVGLLRAVIGAQAALVAGWMGVGFIHGVMNTDNVAISGETIDYGPCAFMDDYAQDRVFSSIDTAGRYRYGQQPAIMHWNLVQFAQSLLPILHDDAEQAIALAQAEVDAFAELYAKAYLAMFAAKLGIEDPRAEDGILIAELLAAMEREGADFTNTFRQLNDAPPAFPVAEGWTDRWERARKRSQDPEAVARSVNPAVVPRTHRIEQAIAAALEGDLEPFHAFQTATAQPFRTPDDSALMQPPLPGERVLATFCGT